MASRNSRVETKDPQPNTTEFVNHGLDRFNQIRNEWRNPTSRRPRREVLRKDVDEDEIVSRLFSNVPSAMSLPEPIPLGQMIEILIDVWEGDGLYD